MKKKIKGAGFTLIELLIASAIFAVVMVVIYSALRSGIFASREIEENLRDAQAARQILAELNHDLRNAFSYSAQESKFQGESKGISFLTLVDSSDQGKIVQDYAWVSYRWEQDILMRLCRRNEDVFNPESKTKPQQISAHLEDLTFSYFYQDQRQELKEKDLWDDPKELPLAIGVKLSIKNKGRREFRRLIFLPLAG